MVLVWLDDTCAGESITGVTSITGTLATKLCVSARSQWTAPTVIVTAYVNDCKQSDKIHLWISLSRFISGR